MVRVQNKNLPGSESSSKDAKVSSQFIDISSSPHFDRRPLISEFDPKSTTWVVSDLETKLDIQTELFKKYNFLPEDAVLRASEVWLKLFKSQKPDIQVVSQNLFEVFLNEWLESKKIEWAQTASATQTTASFIYQFLPLYKNSEAESVFRTWLGANSSTFLRVGSWFFLAREAWQHFESRKVMPASWVPFYIEDVSSWTTLSKRNLIFDLEAQMTTIEVDLIQKLSCIVNVQVISPKKEWRQRHSKVLWPYSVLMGEAIEPASSVSSSDFKNCQLVRATNPISEVQTATSQVREWIDQGVELDQIAIYATDIEKYWPLIQFYFEQEGVSVNKKTVATAQSFKDVSSWLSHLRVESRQFEISDLKSSLYSLNQKPKMSFAEFEALYSNLLDAFDLGRNQNIQQLFEASLNLENEVTREDFLFWSAKSWVGPSERIRLILSSFLIETSSNMKMKLSSWLNYLEKITSRMEFKIDEPTKSGLAFLKFGSGLHEKYSHLIILGLDDRSVKAQAAVGLTTSDILKIGQDVGVDLDHPDKSEAEYYSDWLSSNEQRQSVLSFSHTDFAGEPQAPSLFWLERALENKVQLDAFTPEKEQYWRSRQNSAISDLVESEQKVIIEQDLNLKKKAPVILKNKPSLSASQAERYLQCPFLFLAEKIFRLEDFDKVDFDLDRKSRGRLQHELLERLLEPPVQYARRESEISSLIDEIRIKNKIHVADEKIWLYLKRQYLKLAQQFLKFEKEYSQLFPKNKNLYRELDFKVAWRAETASFVSIDDSQPNDFIFRGKIDRIDGHEELGYVVLDYKATKNEKIRNASSWVENHNLQLALYSQIVEAGLTRLPKAPVLAAFFYVLKNFDRETGFHLIDAPENFFATQNKRKNKLTGAEKNKIFSDSTELLNQVASGIVAGALGPSPREPDKDCPKCKWRSTCRAPHLIS